MAAANPQEIGDPVAFLNARGQTGALIRAYDWAATALGAPATWPHSLKTAVSLMLGSAQPAYVAWGDDLISLYNDGYLPILGDKPIGIGKPFRELWAEIWNEFRPIVEATVRGEPQFFVDMPIALAGRSVSIGYFSFSYTPLRDDHWRIGGFYCAAVETTAQVLDAQRSLAERERLTSMFEQAPGMMLLYEGPDHTIALANPAVYELTGPRDLVGKTLRDAVPEMVEQGIVAMLDEVFRTGEAFVGHAVPMGLERSPGKFEQRYLDFVWQPLKSATGKVFAIFAQGVDVTERHRAEQHQKLLVDELSHRAKNLLAIVQSVAQQTFKGAAPADTVSRFEGRLGALAAAHSILTARRWDNAPIGQIIGDTIDPVFGDRSRIALKGPDLLLSPKTGVSLAMAVHELATNALKYGSLSQPGGTVAVTWHCEDDRLRLEWREAGGPVIAEPTARGFGSRMIERGLAAELNGRVEMAFAPEGLICTVVAPLPLLTP